MALPKSIGVTVGTVTLNDFDQADCLLFFGQNPGSNSPRMLHDLQEARKRGAPIITFNPLRERGLETFVNPGSLADDPDGADRLTDYVVAGHVLADHSYSHPALSKLTAAAYLADVDRAEGWLKGREGYRAWFRYPFLDEGGTDKAKRDAVRAGLKARGLRNGYVTVDGSDWQLESMTIAAKAAGHRMDMAKLRRFYVDQMMQGVEAHYANAQKVFGAKQPIHVMLMHETDIAALFIEDFVKALKAKGWTIVTADAAYADPLGRTIPDPASANGTLTGQIAQARGIGGLTWPALANAKAAQAAFDAQVLGK